MKKHFLVTISNDVNNLFGVQFICSFFNTAPEHLITLLHICQQDKNDMARTLNEMWQKPDAPGSVKISVQASKSIQKAKDLLHDHHKTIDHVMTKTFAERYGKVKDILTEGASGYYDAIILGRRASYALQWMFEKPAEETIRAILKDSCCSTPIWICPNPLPDRKNVLVCLDGSENALRVVDHVGYILAKQDHQKITLFHVETTNTPLSPDIFDRPEKILLEHGVAAARVNRKKTWGLSIAASIEKEANRHNYAVVALGLHGERQDKAKKYGLAGSTTAKLISKAEKVSLWCCP